MNTAMTVWAPAKLNLFLHIVGRRENGYHELQSLMLPVQWADQIQLRIRSDARVERLSDLGFDSNQDLMVRAARLLQPFAKQTVGCDLEIDKQLPMGAGLGGGSSDAASVLLALNQLWELNLSIETLASLAIRLGSDVPFFLYRQAAILEGIGQEITPIRLPNWYYVIVCPDVHVPTAQIFQAPDLNRSALVYSHEQIRTFWHDFQPHHGEVPLWGENALEGVACRLFPALAELRDCLRSLGLAARMSGSGAAFFVVLEDLETALLVQKQIKHCSERLRLSRLRHIVVAKGLSHVAISSQIDKIATE